ncbi:MAG: hypothetical protein ACRDRK_01575 [Pseudonocardia sp.]
MQDGETIEVTNNGEVVAVLVPPPRRPDANHRLRRATVRGGFAGPARIRLSHLVQEDLDDLRGGR